MPLTDSEAMAGSHPSASGERAAASDGDRDAALEALATDLWQLGEADAPTALARASSALAGAVAAGAPRRSIGRLRTTIGHLLIRLVEPRRAERELRAALDELTQSGDEDGQARCLGRLALLEMTTGATHEGLVSGRRAVALALSRGLDGVAMTALANIGASLLDMGDPLGAIEHLAQALELADDAERRADVAHVLGNLAEAFVAVGDLPAAERYASLAVRTADQDTSPTARLVGRLVLAQAHHARGDHEAAVAMTREIEEVCARTGHAVALPAALALRMASLRALGRPAEAVAAADLIVDDDQPAPGARALLRERLLAHLELGDDDAVRLDAERVLAYTDARSPVRATAHEALAEVARRHGDHATEAAQLRLALDVTRAAHQEESSRRNLAIRSRAEVTRAEYDAAEHQRRTSELQRELAAVEQRHHADLLATESDRSDLIAHLERLADEDPLTGLPNRRRLERALEEAPGYLPPEASFALIDVDHFKGVNDRYGHIVGDRVLGRLARLFTRGTRPTDLVARVGGEEFAVLLADDVDHTSSALERLRGVVADEHWGDLAPGLQVTVSIGIVPLSPGTSLTEALERADKPLYAAKDGGRNRVVVGD